MIVPYRIPMRLMQAVVLLHMKLVTGSQVPQPTSKSRGPFKVRAGTLSSPRELFFFSEKQMLATTITLMIMMIMIMDLFYFIYLLKKFV